MGHLCSPMPTLPPYEGIIYHHDPIIGYNRALTRLPHLCFYSEYPPCDKCQPTSGTQKMTFILLVCLQLDPKTLIPGRSYSRALWISTQLKASLLAMCEQPPRVLLMVVGNDVPYLDELQKKEHLLGKDR